MLQTKLYIPSPRPHLVLRQRLLDKLDGAREAKLTLISAPAGYGKTTLLSTWARERDLPAAWLSLDADDNDPARFLIYVATALQAIAPEAGQLSLAMLFSTPPPPINTVLTTLVNELSRLPANFFLFLDDYHSIEAQDVHDALVFLIDHLPQRMHIVIASRSDPPLPLSRLRVRGQLNELRQADLRFTAAEATTFLNQGAGLNLTREQVTTLEIRTEGWIAGLQLAALSLPGKKDVSTYIREFSGSHRFVIDFLADEVLSQQPDEIVYFLQQTSILDRLTAPLCDAVTAGVNSADILKKIEEANLFLVPLDDHREWYRYHPLLSDFLGSQLDEKTRAILHLRAAKWLLANELYSEGVKHALVAGDLDQAVTAVLQAAPVAFNRGSHSTLLGWLNAIPEEKLLLHSDLALYKGFALFLTLSYEVAIPYAAAAEQALSPDAPRATLGHLFCLKAHIALCEEKVDESIQFARQALAHLAEDDLSFRNLTYNILGQVLEMKGDIGAAAEVYDQAFKSGWQAGDQMGALVVFTNLIFALNELGRRRDALAMCQKLAAQGKMVTLHGLPLLDAVYLSQSLLSYEANELETALEQVQRSLTLFSAANFSQGILWGKYILARIYLAKNNFDALAKVSQEGLQLATVLGRESIQGPWFSALGAQAALQQGTLAPMVRWAEAAGFGAHDSPHHWSDFPYFTYIRLLIAQNHLSEAQELLQTMEKVAREGGRHRKLITIYLLQSLHQLASGNTKEAMEKVNLAVSLAGPEDYRRAFLDEGPEITPLLRQARAVAAVFVDQLLDAFGARPAPGAKAGALIDPLSQREQEVLDHVAMGLSNREIADRLVVTVGTVKKHLNNIFSKLGVKSRTQAVSRGRELGLLE